MWTPLDSQEAVDALVAKTYGFHDTVLREIAVSGETFVGPDLSISCPSHLEVSALLFVQCENRDLPGLELCCRGVSQLSLTPTPDGCDSIIFTGSLVRESSSLRLTLEYVNRPLFSHGTGTLAALAAHGPSGLVLVAQSISWRPLLDALGDKPRYTCRPA